MQAKIKGGREMERRMKILETLRRDNRAAVAVTSSQKGACEVGMKPLALYLTLWKGKENSFYSTILCRWFIGTHP